MAAFMTLVFRVLYADIDARLHDAYRSTAAQYPFSGDAAQAAVFTDLSVAVVERDGTTLRVLQQQNRDGAAVPGRAAVARAVTAAAPVTAGPGHAAWRLYTGPLPDGTQLLVAQRVSDRQGLHNHLAVAWVGALLLILAVTAALTTHLVRYGMRPLTGIARTAGRIRAGDLSHRLPVSPYDEIGQLAAALNTMLDRIDCSFTERQAIEDRLRRFVHDAGHELRTPVTAIRGWAELCHRGGVPGDDLPTAMRRISDEATRIGLLVDELLLLATLDHPGPGPRPAVRRTDLAEVVRDAVLDAQVVEPGRPIASDLPGPGVAVVDADPAAMHQVVANLLGNVRAHTPAGTAARVHLQRVASAGGDRIVLRLADDGPGVAPAVRDNVFDRFFRADTARVHHEGAGTGLGLSIVAAIVAGHGGDIRAEPVATGFTIRISLPAAGRARPAAGARTAASGV
jgi:two-component system OmpR family sensor kinase